MLFVIGQPDRGKTVVATAVSEALTRRKQRGLCAD